MAQSAVEKVDRSKALAARLVKAIGAGQVTVAEVTAACSKSPLTVGLWMAGAQLPRGKAATSLEVLLNRKRK